MSGVSATPDQTYIPRARRLHFSLRRCHRSSPAFRASATVNGPAVSACGRAPLGLTSRGWIVRRPAASKPVKVPWLATALFPPASNVPRPANAGNSGWLVGLDELRRVQEPVGERRVA